MEKLEEKYYGSEKVIRSTRWVTTAKGVVEQLDRLQESLEFVGIYYEKSKDRTNKTFVPISKCSPKVIEDEPDMEDEYYYSDNDIDLNSFKDKL